MVALNRRGGAAYGGRMAPAVSSRRPTVREVHAGSDPDTWPEAYLDDLVRDLCRALGLWAYHTHRSDRSAAGYPDWTVVGPGGVQWQEHKTAAGRLSVDQVDVVNRLNTAGGLVRVYRPADWQSGVIADELRELARGPHRPPAPWPAGTYRCGCEVAAVAFDGHGVGCPIERTAPKTAAGRETVRCMSRSRRR